MENKEIVRNSPEDWERHEKMLASILERIYAMPSDEYDIYEFEELTDEEREVLRREYYVRKMKLAPDELGIIRELRKHPHLLKPMLEFAKERNRKDREMYVQFLNPPDESEKV